MTEDNDMTDKFNLAEIPQLIQDVPYVEETFEIGVNGSPIVTTENKGTNQKDKIDIINQSATLEAPANGGITDAQHLGANDPLQWLQEQRQWSLLKGVVNINNFHYYIFTFFLILLLRFWMYLSIQCLMFSLCWSLAFYCILVCEVYLIFRFFPHVPPPVFLSSIFIMNISIFFILGSVFDEEAAAKVALINLEAPFTCGDYRISPILRYCFSTQEYCLDYYRAIDHDVFWKLNPFRVLLSLLLDTAKFVLGHMSKSAGIIFTSFVWELPWYFRLLIIPIVLIYIVIHLLTKNGYALRFPFVRVGPDPHVSQLRNGAIATSPSTDTSFGQQPIDHQ